MPKSAEKAKRFNFDIRLFSPLVSTLFSFRNNRNIDLFDHYNRWKSVFIDIRGKLDTQRHVNIKAFEKKFHIGVSSKEDLFFLIFCLETFFSVILRLSAFKSLSKRPLNDHDFISVIHGGFFFERGIINYFCPSYFNWFLPYVGKDLDLSALIEQFNALDHRDIHADLILSVYLALFPRQIRHSLGEFYTPSWLARHVVDTVTDGDAETRKKTFIDPTCGSGVFLLAAAERIPECFQFDRPKMIGVDINPLSTLSAKTNLLLAARWEKRKKTEPDILLPIFNADIVNGPFSDSLPADTAITEGGMYQFRVKNKILKLSDVSISYPQFTKMYKNLIDGQCMSQVGEPADKIASSIQKLGLSDDELHLVLDRIALMVIPRFDYVVGNPPWVNWEYLPGPYREKSISLWRRYGLFDYKGAASIFVKEDISSLITYIAIDRYLKNNGKLGFVLKESLFKSTKQAAGFRKFYLKPDNVFLNPFRIDDLTMIKPFEGVNNRPVAMFLRKNRKVDYPVQWRIWRLLNNVSLNQKSLLESMRKQLEYIDKLAQPLSEDENTSGWISYDRKDASAFSQCIGKPAYKARTGVFTGGANAVYRLGIDAAEHETVVVRNLNKRAKNKVQEVRATIEKEYVYPLLSGYELGFWNYRYTDYILCPHDGNSKMKPVDFDILEKTPETLKYFEIFKEVLENRKGFTRFDRQIHKDYYYALQRIGAYTFCRYKVAWPFISKTFRIAVVGAADDRFLGHKNIIPNEKITFIGLDDEAEAYYICGLLSSSVYRRLIESFTVGTQLGPGIIENLKIPSYDKTNDFHQKLSALCKEGHQSDDKEFYLAKIDLALKST